MLKHLEPHERPRERAARVGVRALNDRELLALVLGSGGPSADVLSLALRVLATGRLSALARRSVGELADIPGLGPAQASRLAATFELGRRASRDRRARGDPLNSAARLAAAARAALGDDRQEAVLVLLLTARLRLVRVVEVARGGGSSAAFEPADVLRPALREGAPRFALAHNHPSGDPTPSEADALVTARVLVAARAVGVDMVDHLVLGEEGRHFSFAQAGLLAERTSISGASRGSLLDVGSGR